jgi:hypothetical protein
VVAKVGVSSYYFRGIAAVVVDITRDLNIRLNFRSNHLGQSLSFDRLEK